MSTGPTQQTTQTYDQIAAQFAARNWKNDLSELLDRLCACLQPGARILDLGCGPGRDTLSLAARGFWTLGLDRSAGMLREAAARGVKLLVQADSRALPFASGTLNGVWACASLLHLLKAELPAALAEARRALGHGHIWLSLRLGEGETWEDDGQGHPRFFAYYHPAEVELALERAGFRVLHCSTRRSAHRPELTWINALGWTKLVTPQVGVNVAIFDGAGRVLLTRRQDNGLWCLPGGHMDVHETLQQAALRETQEETGLRVELERLAGLYSLHYPAGAFGQDSPARHIVVALFRARATGGELALNDEVTEFGWFAPDRLPEDLIPLIAQRVRDAARETGEVVVA
jgi:8-oxo-dGTP pyrophosphatase MutT (NUDIX family)/ubiquinone/menaquinone biosynthesis C-methylase UbiE